MTDKEQIRNYIEELHDSHRGSSGSWYFRLALRNVLHFIDTMESGQVFPDYIERAVKIDAGGYPYISCDIELYDYDKELPLAQKGDKVKILVIKE